MRVLWHAKGSANSNGEDRDRSVSGGRPEESAALLCSTPLHSALAPPWLRPGSAPLRSGCSSRRWMLIALRAGPRCQSPMWLRNTLNACVSACAFAGRIRGNIYEIFVYSTFNLIKCCIIAQCIRVRACVRTCVAGATLACWHDAYRGASPSRCPLCELWVISPRPSSPVAAVSRLFSSSVTRLQYYPSVIYSNVTRCAVE